MTYDQETAKVICNLRDDGVSWATISKTVGKSKSALKMWWSRHKLTRGLPQKSTAKPKKTDGRVGLALKQIVREKPNLPLRDFKSELTKLGYAEELIPSHTTISKFFSRNNLKIIQLRKKPFISQVNIQKRLEFAKQYSKEVNDLMAFTIWSDETTVRKMPQGKTLLWRCHSSENTENTPINYQVQQGGFSVMFWGCFSAFGLGPLVALDENQNQHTYLQILQEYLLPEIEFARKEYGISMTFMQDNARCHKTALISNFLEKNSIPTLPWPPSSPDLNPIENLWGILKSRRQKRFGFPLSKSALIEQVFEIWEELDQEILTNLVLSIENRLNEVIRLQGRHTKY